MDLPQLIEFQLDFAVLTHLPGRQEPKGIPVGTTAWRVPGADWKPLAAMPGALRRYLEGVAEPAEPKVADRRHDDAGMKAWRLMYARCWEKRRTFKQAMLLFFREEGYWPDSGWPLMPSRPADLYKRVFQVPKDLLTKESRNGSEDESA